MLIVGAALVLSVGTSTAALLIGKDRLLGRSYGVANGLACDTVQSVNIRKSGATWVRKYIRMGDASGIDRVKTALRVAAVVYAESQPDLVQITVLDSNGPALRSNMRGRAIAAQVVFIPDPSLFPDETGAHRFSGFFHDGSANADGQFYGLRIDLPYEDIEALALAQETFADCKNPESQAILGDKDNVTKPEPVNLGAIKPKSKTPVPPIQPEEDDEGGEEGEQLSELLTSTPEAETVSFFSVAYVKSLLFGKGSSVAEAATK